MVAPKFPPMITPPVSFTTMHSASTTLVLPTLNAQLKKPDVDGVRLPSIFIRNMSLELTLVKLKTDAVGSKSTVEPLKYPVIKTFPVLSTPIADGSPPAAIQNAH